MSDIVKNKKKIPLGQLLVDKKLITDHDLWHALVAQQVSGEKLGRVLLGQGSLNSHKLHQAVAEQYGVDFVDLNLNPPDLNLLKSDERKKYLELGVIPWKSEGGKIFIAASDISREVVNWARKNYGDDYALGVTSPFDIYWTVQTYFAGEDDAEARDLLWQMDSQQSAKKLLAMPGSLDLAVIFLLLAGIGYYFGGAVKLFFIAINVFYLITMIFKSVIFLIGWIKHPSLMAVEDISGIDEKDLPVYTILMPLFKENGKIISGLIANIRRLDYPKAKLDVKLIVEAGDAETIEAIKSLKPESIFELIRVPYSLPQTKPKAMNYALRFARGEYVTIYDAEDRPEPGQLKKVLRKFRTSGANVACVQARLNYYNHSENILTKMFAIEYAGWFDYMLNGLDSMGIPLPLGGTSNHFPIQVLRQMYAWDPYNVTEDADLGIRIAQFGYKTKITSSITMEEAPVGLGSWMRQRARWIKGYMQTYIVHMRNPIGLYKALGFRGFIGFQLFIGVPSVVFLTIPVIIIIAAAIFSGTIQIDNNLTYFATGNLLAAVIIQVITALIVAINNRWWKMLGYSLVFPFYWLLHCIASFISLYELIKRPYYWHKTEHGLSKVVHE